MLSQVRKKITQSLWERYLQQTAQMQVLKQGLKEKHIHTLPLDHFAIIDLPGPHTGIPVMSEIFSSLGFTQRGADYLPEKQNDFHWFAEAGCETMLAQAVLPQVVVADFRLEKIPAPVRNIIEYYSTKAKPAPLARIQKLATLQDEYSANELHQLVVDYFTGRDWPLPTIAEFKCVHAFNELIAWVLVFGRRPNHFTISVHHLPAFNKLQQFNKFVSDELQLELNKEGSTIKGNAKSGLEQSSTSGIVQSITLADGEIALPTGFIEFIWRYPLKQPALLWQDYFTKFIPAHANQVIESLYV